MNNLEMNNLKQISKKIHNAIFNNREFVEINGKEYQIKKTSKQGLRCVYYDKYFIVEQNPHKSSHWAQKAKNGAKITWVIKGNDYIAQVYNGDFKRFENEK